MRSVELLRQLTDDERSGGVGEQRELAQVLVRRVAVRRPLERCADEDGALLWRLQRDQISCDGSSSKSRGPSSQAHKLTSYLVPPSVENRPVVL
jgi:hypothetical protein